MRDTLEAVAAGDLTPAEAEARLNGYATAELSAAESGDGTADGSEEADDSPAGSRSALFDASRERRRGLPEGILAEGKTPAEAAALAGTALETTGRALVTRADERTVDRVRAYLEEAHPEATVERNARARTIVARTPDFEPPSVDATVAVVTGGTADATAAGEAAVVAREAGPRVDVIEDVGVANLDRVLDVVDDLRAADCLVVAAGREGALPTVVAGLVDVPVVGLPVSSGYGVGGGGLAALLGMLQSCTVLSTVNVDAGFIAGAQAALVARRVARARTEA
ncbi:nickel pincer cofactor biosynthesis protein LarB [Halorarum halophilum]|uniref:Nickel pincer cofactor biosynthesis protein LarB n=1 Tax=Halorarum halophilum TaxID=2743090 RepID=A0A7D5L2V8_9EURY|nr:nickel pincer cofactor biosynthesis protein LarB [Halobaculum halophilum]QLG28483.1 nickel pincer cofactor biosynthesis protein LarB [Halobaculum halophilum]